MNNLTDEQIIKALECCNGTMSCSICPFSIDRNDCAKLEQHTLDLINRLKAQNKEFDEKIVMQMGLIEYQKAEIERLNIRNKALTDITKIYDWKFAKAKTDAIKEVLSTLETGIEESAKYIREYDDSKEQKAYNKAFMDAYNLVKEMVGENK